LVKGNKLYNNWGLGIGDWGLGIGDWAQSPIPNPQSPIPIDYKKNFFKYIILYLLLQINIKFILFNIIIF
jgi:hypothetical protein